MTDQNASEMGQGEDGKLIHPQGGSHREDENVGPGRRGSMFMHHREAPFSFKIRKQTIRCIFLSGGAWTSKKLKTNPSLSI